VRGSFSLGGVKAVARERFLVVTADDYGIGPDTSQGILDLAAQRLVTATVLLVNSPHADDAARAWQFAGRPLELGWHPCLTLDAPVLPASQVPSLVDTDGRFWPLRGFLRRLWLRQIQPAHVEAEFRAQLLRFVDLVGQTPTVVNAHHHLSVFPPVGRILRRLLGRCRPRPYMRRVWEPWHVLARVPGARLKRLVLSGLGQAEARRQAAEGFPGNDWLAGITDPPCVADPDFLYRWLTLVPGKVVELTCHPGYLDASLIGRDGSLADGQLQRRVGEYNLLAQPRFREALRRAHFTLLSPADLARRVQRGPAHAA
jgi:predicted glycoside hydrolase/deacetylase ChbG (UPF0249 family)